MPLAIEHVGKIRSALGKGPLGDPADKALSWVDEVVAQNYRL
jgi:hypothetical protein